MSQNTIRSISLSFPRFLSDVYRNRAHYNHVVTSNVDAVYDGHVGNHARSVTLCVVFFNFSVFIRALPCPSPCSLLKLRIDDLEFL